MVVSTAADLVATLGLDHSGFMQGLADVTKGLGGVSGLLAGAGLAAAAAFAGVAIANAQEYERSLILIRNRSRENIDNFDTLRQRIAALGEELEGGFNVHQLAEAWAEVASEVKNVDEAQLLVAASARLAKVQGLDLTDTASDLADVLSAWKLEASEAAHATDLLNSASKATGTPIGDLIRMLTEAAPLARNLGLSFEQTVALAGVLKDSGVDSLKAFTNAWLELAKPVKESNTEASKAVQLFQSFGLSIDAAAQNAASMSGALNELVARMQATGAQGFEIRAALTEAFGPGVADQLLKLAESQLLVEERTLRVKDAAGKWRTVIDDVATAEAQAIAVEKLHASVLGELADQGSRTVKESSKAAALFASMGIEVKHADGSLRNLIDVLNDYQVKAAAAGLTSEQSAQQLAEAFGQKTLGAVLALTSGSQELAAAQDALANSAGSVSKAYEGSVTMADKADAKFNQLLGTIGERLLPAVNLLLEGIIALIDSFVRELSLMYDEAVWVFDAIKNAVGTVVDAARNFINQASALLAGFATRAGELGRAIAQGLIDGITGLVGNAVGAVRSFGESIYNSVKDFFGIASPSRLMADVGRNIGAGLAAGIEASGPDVQASFREVATGLVVQAQASAQAVADSFARGLGVIEAASGIPNSRDNPGQGVYTSFRRPWDPAGTVRTSSRPDELQVQSSAGWISMPEWMGRIYAGLVNAGMDYRSVSTQILPQIQELGEAGARADPRFADFLRIPAQQQTTTGGAGSTIVFQPGSIVVQGVQGEGLMRELRALGVVS